MAKRKRSTPGPYLQRMTLLRDRIPDPELYPYALPAVRHLDTLDFHPKVTFFVGENGAGKSTLLEAIAVECDLNPEGGSRNFHFSTRASHSALSQCIRIAKTIARPGDSYFLRAESYFNVATDIERMDRENRETGYASPSIINSYGGKSLHEQSHGESFFALFRNRFGDHGLYLLDEPEAALSPSRQLQFLILLHDYVRRGGQFIIATHSPIIMAYPDACIYHFGADGIRQVPYTETEHFLVTRRFLGNPQRALTELLADEDTNDSE